MQSKIRTEDSLCIDEQEPRFGVNEYGISVSNMTAIVDPNSPEAI